MHELEEDLDLLPKQMELDFPSHAISLFTLRDIFGEDCVSVKDDSVLSVTVDGKTANINLETRVRSCPCVSRHLGSRVKIGIRPHPGS